MPYLHPRYFLYLQLQLYMWPLPIPTTGGGKHMLCCDTTADAEFGTMSRCCNVHPNHPGFPQVCHNLWTQQVAYLAYVAEYGQMQEQQIPR